MGVAERSKGNSGSATAQSSCPLCGSAATRRMQLPHTGVWRCAGADCGLQFAFPQLDDRALNEAYRQLYYPATDGAAPFYAQSPYQVLRQLLDALQQRDGDLRGKRLLDFGAGKGDLCAVAVEFGLTCAAIEPDSNARSAIVRRGIPTYENVTALLSAEPERQFDYIVACEVVEHLRSPWETMEQLHGLLAPTGSLTLTTPNAASLSAALLGERWDQRRNPTHFYYFTARTLAGLLRRTGFSHVQPWTLRTVYPHHGALRKALQHVLSRLALQGDLAVVAKRNKSVHPTGE
jgi:2-polyprenyl-3-methyl-5-hydroxy-6-metoxy-1,4-benzoquinol methylase